MLTSRPPLGTHFAFTGGFPAALPLLSCFWRKMHDEHRPEYFERQRGAACEAAPGVYIEVHDWRGEWLQQSCLSKDDGYMLAKQQVSSMLNAGKLEYWSRQ